MPVQARQPDSRALAPLLKQLPVTCRQRATASATCMTQLENAFFESCRKAGFEYARFTCWSSFLGDDGKPVHAYSVNLSNFPPDWEARYEAGEWYRHDPVIGLLQQQADQPLACGSWASAHAHAHRQPPGDTDSEREQYLHHADALFAEAAAAGLQHGAFLSSKDTGRHTVMSVASATTTVPDDTSKPLWQALFAIVQLLNQGIALTRHCERCTVSLRIDGGTALSVTPSQRKVLQLFLQFPGVGIRDIAQRFGASDEAINYHLKNLRQRFGKPGMSGYALAQFAREHNLL